MGPKTKFVFRKAQSLSNLWDCPRLIIFALKQLYFMGMGNTVLKRELVSYNCNIQLTNSLERKRAGWIKAYKKCWCPVDSSVELDRLRWESALIAN